jgi:hypothetical protein
MLAFISENIANIIISAVLLIVIACIILSLIKKKKRTGSINCSCNCDECPKSQCFPDQLRS